MNVVNLTLTGILGLLLAVMPTRIGFGPARVMAAAAAGVLEISTDPVGALVYLDGAASGQTPVTLTNVAPGDHRVRLVKRGYLENSRVVNVTAGAPRSLRLQLTPLAAEAGAGAAQVVEPPREGGSKAWVWVALAGGAAAGTGAYVMATRNKAPSAGTVSVSPTTALVIGTNVTATAAGASDPDGDSLTYAWDFGDGGSGSGQSASHVYTSAGTFTIRVTVSDGKKQATSSGTVTVRNLTAAWGGIIGANSSLSMTLSQNGASMTGTFTLVAANTVSGTVAGTVAQPNRVNLTLTSAAFAPIVLTGSVDASVLTMSGSVISGFTTNTPTFSVTRR